MCVFVRAGESHMQSVGVCEVCSTQLGFRPLAKTLPCCINMPPTACLLDQKLFTWRLRATTFGPLLHLVS